MDFGFWVWVYIPYLLELAWEALGIESLKGKEKLDMRLSIHLVYLPTILSTCPMPYLDAKSCSSHSFPFLHMLFPHTRSMSPNLHNC
jgi:hypothetical protein